MADTYHLPDLPYSYDALEPWCRAETLHLHHDKHHQAYVTGANAAVAELATVDPGDKARHAGLQRALTFNLAGHVLHSLFWENLAPAPVTPGGQLAQLVTRDFGSQERLRDVLVAASVGVQGSGWGALVHEPFGNRLHVVAFHDHQSDAIPASTVLAVIDVWEHAYYLDYRNERPRWVAAAVEHIDWHNVEARLAASPAAAR